MEGEVEFTCNFNEHRIRNPEYKWNRYKVRKCKQVRNRNRQPARLRLTSKPQLRHPRKGETRRRNAKSRTISKRWLNNSRKPIILYCQQRMNCDMETDQQATSSIPVKAQSILIEAQSYRLLWYLKRISGLYAEFSKIKKKFSFPASGYQTQWHSDSPFKNRGSSVITEMFKDGSHKYHMFRLPGDKKLKSLPVAYPKAQSGGKGIRTDSSLKDAQISRRNQDSLALLVQLSNNTADKRNIFKLIEP